MTCIVLFLVLSLVYRKPTCVPAGTPFLALLQGAHPRLTTLRPESVACPVIGAGEYGEL